MGRFARCGRRDGRIVSWAIGSAIVICLNLTPATRGAANDGIPRKPPSGRRAKQRIATADRVAVVKQGSSSKASREAAERLLRSVRMTRRQSLRVNSVLRNTSFFRELPTLKFEVDPRAYLYLVDQPDVTVSIWRAMGISKFRVQRAGREDYVADNGDGTKGRVEVIQRHPLHQVILCRGVFKSPLLPKGVETRSVIHLQTKFTQDKTGRTFATHRAFAHVSFESTTLDVAAKLLSPVGNLVLDRNFREISLFLHVMSLGMSRQPGWIERIAGRMQDCSDRQKKDLLKVTAKVYYTARRRQTIPLFKTRKEYLRELMSPLKTADSSSKNSAGRRLAPR